VFLAQERETGDDVQAAMILVHGKIVEAIRCIGDVVNQSIARS
jgi:hypothetical protein